MKILAIDTSTDACSVALWLYGEIIERYEIAPRRHLELLQPMLNAVLNEGNLNLAELDALAFGAGPGAFSGLRIACGFIQGLAMAHQLPVASISTLAALSLSVLQDQPQALVLPALDARMGEVYWGAYRRHQEQVLPVLAESVCAPQVKPQPVWQDNDLIVGVGSGWGVYADILAEQFPATITTFPDRYPRAGEVAQLAVDEIKKGNGLMAEFISPIYLRHKVALTSIEQQALRDRRA